MSDISKEPIRVTDHAICRYLERAYGFNIEAIRDHIAGICAAPAAFGAVCVRSEGVRFEIASNCVVTVSPDGVTPSKIGRQRAQNKIARQA
jgi:hypothetical protein